MLNKNLVTFVFTENGQILTISYFNNFDTYIMQSTIFDYLGPFFDKLFLAIEAYTCSFQNNMVDCP